MASRRTPTRCRSFVGVIIAAIVITMSCQDTSAADSSVIEHQVKAAYLSKFGGFVRWPDSAFPSDTSPLTICVIGDNPFGDSLSRAVDGHRVGDRPITVRTMKDFTPNSDCKILFTGDSNVERVSQILKSVRGTGVLTVTDLPVIPAVPAVINFVIKENHVRFEIDERASADNGLEISSQLLGLAVSVRTPG